MARVGMSPNPGHFLLRDTGPSLADPTFLLRSAHEPDTAPGSGA